MLVLLLIAMTAAPAALGGDPSGSEVSLAGTWRVRMDPENSGEQLAWYAGRFDGDTMFLPGSTDQAGLGTKIGSPVHGHLSRPYTYSGVVWYQRDLVIPEEWAKKRIALFLERPHWETRVWVDGKAFGSQDSLTTPHVYDLTAGLSPGAHILTVAVDNSYKYDVGRRAHSVTDETQTNWNGVVGRLELQVTDAVWIKSVRLHPMPDGAAVRMEVDIENSLGQAASGELTGSAPQHRATATAPFTLPPNGASTVETVMKLGRGVKPWDEYEANLFDVIVRIDSTSGGRSYRDSWKARWGARNIGTKDKQFVLNGRPIFLRGTLECNIFPRTGYPPMRTEDWDRLFRIARGHGLNHIRFHSWCPPEAAFDAADRAGFLLHVELPVWSNKLGSDPKLEQFMRDEAERILRTYGNHPSFTMLCLGNELLKDFDLMDRMVADLKARDGRRLYTFSADHRRREAGKTSDYFVTHTSTRGPVRIHGSRFAESNDGTDFDFSDHVSAVPMPLVAHELGQWLVYPSYDEIAKYDGVLKAKNLEMFRDQLAGRGMLDLARPFQLASGKFAWLVYKEDIEAALRTPNFGGVQLLQLQDFPGQGEALIGLLDSFWESKGIFSPAEFRRFFSETVPLARFPKFVWTNEEDFTASVQVAHYGKTPVNGANAAWSLTAEDGTSLAKGSLDNVGLELGTVTAAGNLSVPLAGVSAAKRLRLEVTLEQAGAENSWDIWVYPESVETKAPPGVVVASEWNRETLERLESGDKVLLLWPGGRDGKNTRRITFLPIFWSTVFFGDRYSATTLGVFCDPKHPALNRFPTDAHSNWQWWEVTEGSSAFILNETPMGFRPIVQMIDDLHRNDKLGAVFETRVGKGKLLVSSFDLESELQSRPVARQLRHSLLSYMSGDRFQPSHELDRDTLDQILAWKDQ